LERTAARHNCSAASTAADFTPCGGAEVDAVNRPLTFPGETKVRKACRQKFVTIFFIGNGFVSLVLGEPEMRIAQSIFAGSTALMLLSAPALAKNSNAPKNDEKPASSPSCRAYQQAADGSWTERPCQEGSASQAPTQRKSATKTQDEETR
jgi:hypothetical protein